MTVTILGSTIHLGYLLAFGLLLWTALSVRTTLWIANRLANKDLGDETPPPRAGEAWTRATTREPNYGRMSLRPSVAYADEDTQPATSIPPPVSVVDRKVGT